MEAIRPNQVIISGTAYYSFNHFCAYWQRYKRIVESGGDHKKLEDHGIRVEQGFNHRDYSVMRMPVEALPEGFMDEKNIARSRASFHDSIFQMEMGAVFVTDSQGFFKRSLVESCVAKGNVDLGGGPIEYTASLRGNPAYKYVYGVDPASEQDHFSIVVLELHNNHARIVYVWTTTREAHKKRVMEKLTDDNEFYSYCARKIRSLMRVFPCERIGIDSQGGGYAVLEALHDKDKLQEGELPIWEVKDPDPKKYKDTDNMEGLHLIELIHFSNAEWVANANHGMRKDFEDKVLLFPFFDAITMGLALEDDIQAFKDGDKTRMYDSLDECVAEIEELKDELATIQMTQTGITGRDRWDTPETKLPGGKKGRLRKDRYSALLIANMLGRCMRRDIPPPQYETHGSYLKSVSKANGGQLYGGNTFLGNTSGDWYGGAVKRR